MEVRTRHINVCIYMRLTLEETNQYEARRSHVAVCLMLLAYWAKDAIPSTPLMRKSVESDSNLSKEIIALITFLNGPHTIKAK